MNAPRVSQRYDQSSLTLTNDHGETFRAGRPRAPRHDPNRSSSLTKALKKTYHHTSAARYTQRLPNQSNQLTHPAGQTGLPTCFLRTPSHHGPLWPEDITLHTGVTAAPSTGNR
ncbi:Hypothetical predicted protein [Pelobates cultripes]|uniref:Uncharacterized protein n=1 Tax=Pelobates cultripes TaxID=61616 RepID=A0AAD1SPL2_PELCU|nr:Hypothetical predicted protein [Pelobates cultripes]